MALLAAEEAGEQPFAPVLDPLHRAAKPQGRRRDGDFFPPYHAFQPEAAADVRDDDADLPFPQAEAPGQRGAHLVRDLAGNVHDELIVAIHPFRKAAARLQRQRVLPLAAQRGPHHALGGGENLIHVIAERVHRQKRVRAQLVMHARRVCGQGIADGSDEAPRRIVHNGLFDAVLGRVRIVGDDYRDGFTGVADPVCGQDRHRRGRELGALQQRGQSGKAQVSRGECGQHTVHGAHPGQVDGVDLRCGQRASHECGRQGTGLSQVVDEPPAPGQQPRVFLARDGRADPGSLPGHPAIAS